MEKKMLERIKAFLRARRNRNAWYRIMCVLASLVVFITTYMLILPAITMERETYCGLEEHIHTEACYQTFAYDPDQILGDDAAAFEPDGTAEPAMLVCGKKEHRHSDVCYEADAAELLADPDAGWSDGGSLIEDPDAADVPLQADGTLPEAGRVYRISDTSEIIDGEILPEESENGETAETAAETEEYTEQSIETDETRVITEETENTENTEDITEETEEVSERERAVLEETAETATGMGQESGTGQNETAETVTEPETEEALTEERVTETEPVESETEEALTEERVTETELVETETEPGTEVRVTETEPAETSGEDPEGTETESETESATEADELMLLDIEEAESEQMTLLAASEADALDIRNYVTSVVTKKLVGGRWISTTDFTDGDNIQVRVNYTIPSNTIPGDTISYILPAGMTIKDGELENLQDIRVTQNGVTVGHAQIVYDQATGLYTFVITFNTDETSLPAGEATFNPQESFNGNFMIQATVSAGDDNTDREMNFGGNSNIITIKHQETGSETGDKTDLSISKEGAVATINPDGTITIQYTVTAYTTCGSDGPVSLSDVLQLNFVTDKNGVYGYDVYDENSFQLKKFAADGTSTEITDKQRTETVFENPNLWNGKIVGFEYKDLPELAAGESYVLTYSVTVKVKEETVNSTGTWNNAWAKDSTSQKESDYVWIVPITKLSKAGELDQGKNRIKWTITVSNAGGYKLKDVLGENIKDIPMKDISITGGELNGSLSQADLIDGYVLPSNDEYKITYYTDVSDLTEGTVAENHVSVYADDGTEKKSAGAEVTVHHLDWGFSKSKQSNTDTYDLDGKVSGAQITWNAAITFPDKEWTEEIYYDVIRDADGYAGSHYGIATSINDALKSALDQAASKVSYTVEYYSDEAYETCAAKYNGTEFTYEEGCNDSTKIKSFMITFRPSEDVADARTLSGEQISFTYPTIANYEGMSNAGEYVFTNTGSLNDVSHDASYTHKIIETVEPSLSKESGEVINGTTVYGGGTTTVNYVRNGNVLYYRLKIAYDPNATSEDVKAADLVIRDELPAGVSYCDPSEIQVQYQWDSGNGWGTGWTPAVTKETNAETGVKSLTITCPRGQWFNSGANTIVLYYTATIDGWDGTDQEIVNKASVNDGEPKEQITKVVNEKELVAKSGVQYDTDGNEIHPDENGNIEEGVVPSNRVKYTVEVNPDAKTLNEGEDLVLTDKLSTANSMSAYLDSGSIVLYYYSETEEGHKGALVDTSFYSVSYNERDSEGNYVMTIKLPDSTAFILEYVYIFDVEDIENPTVSNSIELNGRTSSVTDWVLANSNSSATVDQAHVTITKVDEDDIGKTLPQAKFKVEYFQVYELNLDEDGILQVEMLPEKNGQWVTLEETATSGVHGTLEFDSSFSAGDIMALHRGCIYRMTEIAPPPGYAGTGRVYYFAVRSGKVQELSQDDSIYTEAVTRGLNGDLTESDAGYIREEDIEFFGTTGGTDMFTNKANSVAVRKIWQDYNGYEIEGEPVTVQLYRQAFREQSYTVTVKNNGNNKMANVNSGGSVTIRAYASGIPVLKDSNGKTYEYDKAYDYGWGIQYVYTIRDISDNMSFMITDAYGSFNDFDIVADNSAAPGYAPEGEPVAWGEPVVLNHDNAWNKIWDGLETESPDGSEKYFYTVKEVGETNHVYTAGGQDYTVIYNNNNGITAGEITVVNRCQTQYIDLKVNKIWKDAFENDVTAEMESDVTITFTLYQDEEPIGTYTLGRQSFTAGENCKYAEVTPEQAWEGKIYYLPAGHNYTVQEAELEGYTADNGSLSVGHDDNGNPLYYGITITNTEKNGTGVRVKKQWKASGADDVLTDDQLAKLLPADTQITFHLYGMTEVLGNVSQLFDDNGGLKVGVEDQGTKIVSADEGWEASWSELPGYKEGQPYYYWVVEEGSDHSYEVAYDQNGISEGTITVTNTIPVTSVNAEKKWKLPDAADGVYLADSELRNYIPADTQITFRLYGSTQTPDNVLDESGKLKNDALTAGTLVDWGDLQVSASNQWKCAWSSLPVEDADGNALYYYVAEEAAEGTSSHCVQVINNGTNGTASITVVNEVPVTSITVKKVWRTYSGEETSKASGDPLYIDLIRIVTPSTGEAAKEEVIKTLVMDAPYNQIIEDKLPTFGTGSDGTRYNYTYKVEEAPVNGYSVTYANNGGIPEGTITIYNQSTTSESYVLPETGGSGTQPYTVGGLLISAMACLLLYIQNKRRKEEGGSS